MVDEKTRPKMIAYPLLLAGSEKKKANNNFAFVPALSAHRAENGVPLCPINRTENRKDTLLKIPKLSLALGRKRWKK